MEDEMRLGRIRSIGVSNFHMPDLEELMNIADILPYVVQAWSNRLSQVCSFVTLRQGSIRFTKRKKFDSFARNTKLFSKLTGMLLRSVFTIFKFSL